MATMTKRGRTGGKSKARPASIRGGFKTGGARKTKRATSRRGGGTTKS